MFVGNQVDDAPTTLLGRHLKKENTMNLNSNLRALVTGGTAGLGQALVSELRARGVTTVPLARTRRDDDALFLRADVGEDDAHGIAARARELAGGPIDLLIHNASTLGPTPMPHLGELSARELERVFQVNVLGPARLTRALLGPMRASGRGLILAVSSDAAVHGYPGWGAYGASKAALDALMRSLAAELEGSGVHASSVDPTEMNTKMHRDALPDADPETLAKPIVIAKRILARLERQPLPLRFIAEAV